MSRLVVIISVVPFLVLVNLACFFLFRGDSRTIFPASACLALVLSVTLILIVIHSIRVFIKQKRGVDFLFQDGTDLILNLDGRGRVLGSPPDLARLLGYDKKEFDNQPFASFIHPEDAAAFASYMDELRKFDGMPISRPLRLKSADGRPVHFDVSGINFILNPFVRHMVLRLRDMTREEKAKEALARQRESQGIFLDSLPAVVYIKDKEDRYLWVNRRFSELVGRAKDQVIGHLSGDIFPEKDAARYRVDERTVLQSGKAVTNGLESFATPAGTVWLRLDVSPFRDEDERTIGIFGFGFDVTRLKEAQEQLLDSENKYESIFRLNPAVMMIVDPDSGAIIDANISAFAFYGFPSERLLAMNVTDLNPGPAHEVLRTLTEVKKKNSAVYRTRHKASSGLIRDIEIYAGPIEIGSRIFLFFIVHDIMDQILMERKLAENEIRYRTLFESAEEGIVIVSPEGRLVECNDKIESLFRFTREEAEAHDWTGFLPERQPDGILSVVPMGAHFQSVLKGEEQRFSFKLKRKDGVEFDSDIMMKQVVINGDSFVYVLIHDLTERSRMQSELIRAERWAAVGHLAAGIAHEFNNLMTIIKGNAELLKDETAAYPSTSGLAEVIIRQVKRGADMIMNLRAYSQRLPPDKEPCYISEVIEEVLSAQSRMLADEKITVTTDFQVSGYVNIDRSGFRQIFENLITNSRHAIKPKGGGRIGVSLSEDNGMIAVSVKDDGIGFNEVQKKNVFTPFYTTKGAWSSGDLKLPGTGLGLAVAYTLVKQHNGSIAFESEEGRGTTFIIRLPDFKKEGQRADPGTGVNDEFH